MKKYNKIKKVILLIVFLIGNLSYAQVKENTITKTISEITNPQSFSKTKYGVIYKNISQNKQIHFIISIEKPSNELIIVDKGRTYLNNTSMTRLVEHMFEKVETTIYPLQLGIKNNQEISSIKNEKDILERWNNVSSNFNQNFNGDVFQKIEKKLIPFYKKPNNYINQINNHLFYSIYFLPIYKNYSDGNKTFPYQLNLITTKQKINYQVKINLQKELTRAGKILLEVIGKEDNSKIDEMKKSKFNFTYILNEDDYKIYSIAGEITYYDNNLGEQKLTFELYDLVNNPQEMKSASPLLSIQTNKIPISLSSADLMNADDEVMSFFFPFIDIK